MRADRPDVVHLPRPSLVTIRGAGPRAHPTQVAEGAALVALERIVLVGDALRNHAAIRHPQRAHSHALVAHAHAAVTQDAARRIEIHHRRPLLLRHVNLTLREAALARAVTEHHILQFA